MASELVRVHDATELDPAASIALAPGAEVVAWLGMSPNGPARIFAAVDPLPAASELEIVTVSVTRTSGAQVQTHVHAVLVRDLGPAS